MAARMAIMAMTTSNSIKVKAWASFAPKQRRRLARVWVNSFISIRSQFQAFCLSKHIMRMECPQAAHVPLALRSTIESAASPLLIHVQQPVEHAVGGLGHGDLETSARDRERARGDRIRIRALHDPAAL